MLAALCTGKLIARNRIETMRNRKVHAWYAECVGTEAAQQMTFNFIHAKIVSSMHVASFGRALIVADRRLCLRCLRIALEK